MVENNNVSPLAKAAGRLYLAITGGAFGMPGTSIAAAQIFKSSQVVNAAKAAASTMTARGVLAGVTADASASFAKSWSVGIGRLRPTSK